MPPCNDKPPQAVHGTEVAVTVDKRISEGEVLCKSHKRVINGRVTVGVILTENLSDGVCALSERLIRGISGVVHGIDDTAVNRLQTISDVRQRSRGDYRHRVLYERRFHGLFKVNIQKLFQAEINIHYSS